MGRQKAGDDGASRGTIVLAGATGAIGVPLVRSLVAAGRSLVVLTRRPAEAAAALPAGVAVAAWTGTGVDPAWAERLRGAHAVVNLAGANVGTRPWTRRRMALIRSSRVRSTEALVEAIAGLQPGDRPRVLLNASGIDVYGDRGDEIVTERSEPGASFLAEVCRGWEEAARGAEVLGTRVVLLRIPLVVSRRALALRLLALPFRVGLGGPIGSGDQWLSWVHLSDTVALIRFALEREEIAGPLNVAAPDPRPQREVAALIGSILGRPARVRAPAAALRLILREQAAIVLQGQRALPEKALAAGYRFRYPVLAGALREAL